MSNDYKFSLDNFKRWMKENHDQDYTIDRPKNSGPVGTFVESKIGLKKLVSKITSEDDNIEQMASEFSENGGRIIEVNGLDFLIEVNSGNFYLGRIYCRKS